VNAEPTNVEGAELHIKLKLIIPENHFEVLLSQAIVTHTL
jgi:hypothetical protein